ncbi:hypothetical protein [Blastococcus sp. SYSU D01042]
MTRPAAAGAGGRPAVAPSAGICSRRGAALGAALLPVLLSTVTGLAPSAAAAAPVPALVPVPAAAPADAEDDASDPDRPVQVDINIFEPRTISPGSRVIVRGTLRNTGPEAITDLTVRLQRGEVLTSRDALVQVGTDGDEPAAVAAPFQTVEGSIAPGGTLPFVYDIDSAELRLDGDGAYPVLLNVNGSVDDDTRRVGEVSTYLVQQPLQPTARTAVAWIWPLAQRTSRTAAGAFADDELLTSVSDEGRLDRALEVVERLPTTAPPGSTTPVPSLPVTLAIDPALVEELQHLEAGAEVPGDDGSAVEAAGDFLGRLKAVAAVHPVVALPYGDVDLDSLAAAGLGDVVTRSLPGTPAGTAQDPLGAPAEVPLPSATPPAGGTGAPAGDTPAPEDGAGARILADALDVEPRTDVAWAPGGTLRSGTLSLLLAGGVEQVVLGPDAVSTGGSAVGLGDPTAAAALDVVTATGEGADALVADARLSEVVAGSEQLPGGPRLAAQRYLAELAVLTEQADPGTEQTVLVAPPREVDAGPDGAGAMMADTTSTPWLRPASLDELDAGLPGSAELVEPADPVLLEAGGLVAVGDVLAGRDDLAGAVEGDAATALQSFDAAVARSTSVAWREDPDGFRAATGDVAATLQQLRSRVTLLAPADGTYTLASSDAPLVLTVRNDLPFAVRVLPEVRARGNRALSIGRIEPRVLAPGERATLQVPTSLGQSGGFAVTATLTTPGGSPLGERVQLQVRSTAYGPISLIITIGAASLLGLLFLRRLVHFVLRRRARATGIDDGGPPVGPDGTPVAPPTRSPV